MKRSSIILAPPLVFALTAMLAWFVGSPAEKKSEERRPTVRSHRQRAEARANVSGLPGALLRMESRILPHNPAPPAGEIHNAKGMDKLVRMSEPLYCGSGMGLISYAFDWAEEAPEEMFDWLVGQNQKRSSETSILFSTWANSNTEAALTASLKIPNPKLRAQALMSTLEVLCKSNPARAEELLRQNLSIFPTHGYGPTFNGGEAFSATWNLVLSLPLGKKRTHLQVSLLNDDQGGSVWSNASENERREWVDAGFSPYKPDPKSFEGLEDLMRERAESASDSEVASRFIQNYGNAWAKRDLAASLDWAQAHLKGEQRVEAREKLFQTGIRQDFDTTLRIWRNLPDGDLKRSAAKAIRRATPDSRKAELEDGGRSSRR